MFKIYNNFSPLYLKKIFSNTSSVYSYDLRNSEINLHIPRYKSEKGKCNLHYRGSVLWNKIPAEVRHQANLNAFKLSLSNKETFLKLLKWYFKFLLQVFIFILYIFLMHGSLEEHV